MNPLKKKRLIKEAHSLIDRIHKNAVFMVESIKSTHKKAA